MEQSELAITIENGISFFSQIESFNFSLKHIDIFDKLGAKNFEKIKAEAMKTNASFPYSRDFVKTSLEVNKREAVSFTEQILESNSGKALLTLPIEKQAMDLFDGATLFHYDGEERTIIASKIILFRTDLSYNALSLVHENTHILFNNPAPAKGFHIHYNELLPILMELIATMRFEETLRDPNLLKHYIDIRIKTLRDHITEYMQGLQLRAAGVKNHIAMEYSIHNSYSYIIAIIYALRLFELYKEEPIAMKKWIQDAITHQRKVEDLLADANVSLKDKDTIKATEKVLKMYQK
ncbi:MAG: hypothetical protein HFH09_02035 [Bacilli bacterium]|jgi:hypothetical protein|nr:hypothetical protein [Bacilli bacterium]